MNDYRIESKPAGGDWIILGRFRDDISQRDIGLSAHRLAEITVERLSKKNPQREYRLVPYTHL